MLALPPAAYTASAWTSFFSAQVSASATLTGLLFVAVSINLTRILEFQQLAALTAKALAMLMAVLLTSTFCLVPGQTRQTLGLELAVFGVFSWIVITFLLRAAVRDNSYITPGERFFKTVISHAATLPTIVCGVSLLVGRGGGLYWLLGTVFLALLGAIFDGWVLLIEIKR